MPGPPGWTTGGPIAPASADPGQGGAAGRPRVAVVAFLVGLASLALCPPVGVGAVALGVVALRRVGPGRGRPGRGLAIGAVAAGFTAVLMTAALAWFYVVAIDGSGTTITGIDVDAADGRCDEARALSDPDC